MTMETIRSIKDVARLAGVSVGTASMALNDKWHKKVKTEVVERIKAIARAHNYQLNPLGRSLQLKRYFRIGLFIDTGFGERPIIGGYSFYDFITHFTDRIGQAGYALDIVQINDATRGRIVSSGAYPGNNDAAVFLEWRGNSVKELLGRAPVPIPYMIVGDDLGDHSLCYVFRNVFDATYAVFKRLLDNGHRRVAIIKSGSAERRFQLKLQAYRQALSDAGLPFDASLVVDLGLPSNQGLQVGRAAAAQLLAERRPPTAFFCDDNLSALGLLWHLESRQIKMPDDVEVVGYGDEAIAALSATPLTFLRIPSREVADFCAANILGWCESKGSFAPLQREFHEALVVGETTRP